MIDLKALQGQVKILTADLAAVVAEPGPLRDDLRREYDEAFRMRRTGGTYETWLTDVLDQAAVAWVLGCVFVRFCEDNRLVEPVWIGGADPQAAATAGSQARQAYLVKNPLHNDRHWLREAFVYLRELRATGRIFGEHNPVWRFGISADAAEGLLDFFRHREGAVSLSSPSLDTRFLGDLYQDLSAHAQDVYALFQTPVFVEEFILDRTFDPAVAEFGLKETSVVDPACGSGHFLLGAFDRLVKAWTRREPGADVRLVVERALGQVTGVDINPFAVAIARFRLLVASLKACGLSSLERAPQFSVRVAVGDSLLRWGQNSSHQGDLLAMAEGRSEFVYWTEDGDLLAHYLSPGQYTVVVGNPPYIPVRDKALNGRYRRQYRYCSGKYALTVPFAERFFDLALRADHNGERAGYVGQITSNSFMKREFGKKLINEFYRSQVELTEIIDSSVAYIPGHGTPTAILVGRNRLVSPRYSGSVRTILGIQGESSQPTEPAEGQVWKAILGQIDRPGSESEWISVADIDRGQFANHPWSLAGGRAPAVMSSLGRGAVRRLSAICDSVGITSFTLEDDLYVQPARVLARQRLGSEWVRPMVLGEGARDWVLSVPDRVAFPYNAEFSAIDVEAEKSLLQYFWPARTSIANSQMFGGVSKVAAGLKWTEYGRLTVSKLRTPLSIVFASVATHNHFVLATGGTIFKQTAPVIKLPENATEDEHFQLLGVLNSSTACFWLKQVSYAKTGADNTSGGGNRWSPEPWYSFYDFTGTKLLEFPLPSTLSSGRPRTLHRLASELKAVIPASVAAAMTPTSDAQAEARRGYESLRGRMMATQEELDWEIYSTYGLIGESMDLTDPPNLGFGERAFEIVLARRMALGVVDSRWFSHHGFSPITELPAHWSDEYRSLVERRIALIESDPDLGLLERPEYKRRWAALTWEEMQTTALRDWLLDCLEAPDLWAGSPTLASVAQLGDRVRSDEKFRSVLDLRVGSDHHDVVKTLAKLIADEHVPHLPADRYKPPGLAKRAQWERTWALQRREDAGETVTIAVPPKYTGADFKKASFWSNRGKLDVPKERFISYPKLGSDGEDLYGWAGWDQLDQARALAALYRTRKTQDRWPADKLVPILAGLRELEPWLHQWFAEPQRGFKTSPAEFFTGLINTELSQHGLDRSELDRVRGVEEIA